VTGTGATPRFALTGWVYLDAGYTIRWQRGDPVAFVFRGQQMDNHGKAGVLTTIAVPPSGWTDLGEIRQVGQRWLQQRRRPSAVA
jgi:hypothetical protein